ncbi:MAG: response regulator [Deltaproteobacteria bacterium]|nr:response regulator [Deltaproteobacteria bacterium]
MPHSIDVLMVEDDPLIALNTKRALRRSPKIMAVSVATDGQDALDRLLGGTLAFERLVILTDLSMPRLSGLELAAAIRAEPSLRHLPIVVLTTSNDDADRQAAAALMVAGYFVRSSTTAHLEDVVACLCANAQRAA